MNVGDLVVYQDVRWIAVRVDHETRMTLLVNQTGGRMEVPDTIDIDSPGAVQVLGNPPTEWCLIAFPTKRGTGPIMAITVPGAMRNNDLETWGDWVPSDPVREGGALYFHPDLRLRPGEVLLATFRNGTKGRITIPRSFGTVSQRTIAAAAPPVKLLPAEERNRFNRDVIGEDD